MCKSDMEELGYGDYEDNIGKEAKPPKKKVAKAPKKEKE